MSQIVPKIPTMTSVLLVFRAAVRKVSPLSFLSVLADWVELRVPIQYRGR